MIKICACVHTCSHKSAIKKNESLSSATTWADTEGIVPHEISHIEKDNYHTISLIHEV